MQINTKQFKDISRAQYGSVRMVMTRSAADVRPAEQAKV
jgi:hypothetical protein